MSSQSYLMGVRIGRALAGYEILERIIKYKFKDDYKIYKYKLRRLSDIEINELFMELVVKKDINVIKKYIR